VTLEHQTSGIPHLKMQDATDDVRRPYTAFRSSAAAVGESSLHAAFRQVLLFAPSALPPLSAAVPEREPGSPVHSQEYCHVALNEQGRETRGLMFCFSLAMCHT